ncbi:unnamed protein product [Coregonus sp. 'balchen']|nr:unnamed protein product [Coregonus sp. 'balchen']
MDRESYHNCCSLVKISRQSYEQFWSSHFVDYIEKDLSYSKFFKKYLLPNHPCMFSRKFTEDWKCRKQWVTEEGKPNFQKLLQQFDETPVPVANCNAKEYNANPKQMIPFKEFIHYWREYIQNGHSSPKGCLYLKDWHMSSIGILWRWTTTGSSTWDPKAHGRHFHADVFRSYSWSANICGRKKWLLYPPGQEEFLRDSHGNLAYDVTSPEIRDKGQFPHCDEACQPLEIIQEAGEIIFVPSGWHHQVYNLAIMKSCSGIDYVEFASFLKIIADNRMSFLSSCSGNNSSNYPRHLSETLATLGLHHAAFDLQRVAHILECMLCNEDFKRLDHSTLSSQPESLLQQIRETMHSTRGQHSLYQE